MKLSRKCPYKINLDSLPTNPLRTGFIDGRLEWKWTLYYNDEWAGSSPWFLASKEWVNQQALNEIKRRKRQP